MARSLYMRFPGGVSKTLTLSYDDGVRQDIRLMEILDKNGIKCTFNLNSGIYTPEGTVNTNRMPRSQITAAYTNSGHEVAVHAYDHPYLEQLPTGSVAYEIIKDRETLEEQFGTIVRGMAYPYGTYSNEVVDTLRLCGIVYARTIISTEKFDMPTDWLRLPTTCHHKNPRLMELAKRFAELRADRAPQMFYLWGHSYEFDNDNNWNVIEEFAEYIGGREDIWYATNIEIYEYEQAYKQLIFSVDYNTVKNPTAYTLWFAIEKTVYSIAPGETLRLCD
ncbi:MAG: polysaccharide deacetylase family protein [Clostridia bacterium]|nr:polysaccharide deacetylase family protein [Clostridia bacterium]